MTKANQLHAAYLEVADRNLPFKAGGAGGLAIADLFWRDCKWCGERFDSRRAKRAHEGVDRCLDPESVGLHKNARGLWVEPQPAALRAKGAEKRPAC